MARGITYRIKEMLEQKGITQKELSEKTGITESAISHYVKGDRVPRGANLVKMAKALGTIHPVMELLQLKSILKRVPITAVLSIKKYIL